MVDAQLASNVIYGIQAILGILAIHGILYRIIAIDTRLLTADGSTFFRFVSQIRQGQPNEGLRRVNAGWLRWVSDSRSNEELASQVESLYCRSQAYLPILAMVAAIETLFGLLGTVAGFIVSESIDSMSLSIAFGTTFWGIVASLPPTVYLYCSETFRNRLHFQMQTLLEAVTQNVPTHRSVDPETSAKPIQDLTLRKAVSTAPNSANGEHHQTLPHSSKLRSATSSKVQRRVTSPTSRIDPQTPGCEPQKGTSNSPNDSVFAMSLLESVEDTDRSTRSAPATAVAAKPPCATSSMYAMDNRNDFE